MLARGENGKLRVHLENTLGPDRFASEWSASERVFHEDLVQEVVSDVAEY